MSYIDENTLKARAFKFISQFPEEDIDKRNAVINFVKFFDEEEEREEKEREAIWK